MLEITYRKMVGIREVGKGILIWKVLNEIGKNKFENFEVRKFLIT